MSRPRVLSAFLQNSLARLDFWLTLACGVAGCWGLGQILLFPFGRDQGIYAQVARTVLEGGVPYRDAWDFKTPGIFLVFALAEAAFGAAMWGVRVLECGVLLANASLLVLISRRYFSDLRPGILAAAIATVIQAQLGFWHTGQPETFASTCILGAYYWAGSNHESRAAWLRWASAALLCGVAFLLKPPIAAPALLCAALVSRGVYDRLGSVSRAGLAVLGFTFLATLPICAVFVWLLLKGAGETLHFTFVQFLPGYTQLTAHGNAVTALLRAIEHATYRQSLVLVLGVPFAYLLPRVSTREGEGLSALMAMSALGLVGVALQAKYFEYHFATVTPLVALAAALGWHKIWLLLVGRLRSGGAAVFAGLLVLCGLYPARATHVPEAWALGTTRLTSFVAKSQPLSRQYQGYAAASFDFGVVAKVSDLVKQRTLPSDTVYLWGVEPVIYWLSERRPASSFIYNVPQRVEWQSNESRTRLLADLALHQPRLILVQHGDVIPGVVGNARDSAASLSDFPELQGLLGVSYLRAESLGNFDIWERRGAGAEGRPGRGR
jgi:hypothetical protein